MSEKSVIIEKTHSWLPEEKTNPAAESFTHVRLHSYDLLAGAKHQRLPVARHGITRKLADQLLVLVDEDHCLEVVHVPSHANVYLFDHLAFIQRMALLEGHLRA